MSLAPVRVQCLAAVGAHAAGVAQMRLPRHVDKLVAVGRAALRSLLALHTLSLALLLHLAHRHVSSHVVVRAEHIAVLRSRDRPGAERCPLPGKGGDD